MLAIQSLLIYVENNTLSPGITFLSKANGVKPSYCDSRDQAGKMILERKINYCLDYPGADMSTLLLQHLLGLLLPFFHFFQALEFIVHVKI